MPDTTYLHIQGRESDPTRVVAMPGAAVRIGRGVQCEVRLSEPGLAEVQCLLRRRGDTWQIQPVGPSSLLTIEGQPVEHPRALPFGVPLQVGGHRLVIRPGEWGSYQAPFEVGERFNARRSVDPKLTPTPSEPTPRPEPVAPQSSSAQAEVERLKRWQARLEQRERWLKSRQEEKKWEARWKAAGEEIRSKSPTLGTGLQAASTRPPAARPTPTDSLRPLRPVTPTSRNDVARPLSERSTAPAGGSAPKATSGQSTSLAVIPPDALIVPVEPRIIAIPIIESPPVVPSSFEEVSADVGPETSLESLVFPIERYLPDADLASIDGLEVESGFLLPIETLILAESERADPIWDNARGDVDATTSPAVSPPDDMVIAPEPPRREPVTVLPRPSTKEQADFPSAAAIFAAQGTRSIPELQTKRGKQRRPIPTDPRGPAEWSSATWLALPPVAIVSLGLMTVGLFLGLSWSKDNMEAGRAVRSALRSETESPASIDPAVRPETRWWTTTAGHLAFWAAAIERSPEASERASEVDEILSAANRASPLQPEIRLALGRKSTLGTTTEPTQSLGLSRDVIALTHTARTLKKAGKSQAAIHAYRHAMEMATDSQPATLGTPVFDDDPHVRRFRLPHEALIQGVATDMLDAGGWDSSDWSSVVPASPLARFAVARVLREKGNVDASKLFDLAVDANLPGDPALHAENLAAKAEALAFMERKPEAAEGYRRAIDRATDETTRRRWQLGLAEILSTLGASKERAELLEAAKGTDPTEDVTRKAMDAQNSAGLK